jgi:hypothetical protein
MLKLPQDSHRPSLTFFIQKVYKIHRVVIVFWKKCVGLENLQKWYLLYIIFEANQMVQHGIVKILNTSNFVFSIICHRPSLTFFIQKVYKIHRVVMLQPQCDYCEIFLKVALNTINLNPLSEMMRSYKCILHASKMWSINYNLACFLFSLLKVQGPMNCYFVWLMMGMFSTNLSHFVPIGSSCFVHCLYKPGDRCRLLRASCLN